MPATKAAKSKDTSEAIEAELETLQYRNAQATSGVEQARQRLDVLAARRGEIASAAYFGDEAATKEIKKLDAESSNLVRVVALARDAGASLETDIEDAKKRLVEERRSQHETRLAKLRQDRGSVHEEALAAADALLDVLARDRQIHGAMVAAAQGVSARTLEVVSQDHAGAGLHRALSEKLRTYASAWI
jgi:DNA repair exonuclease SbcCD ATPase subunit